MVDVTVMVDDEHKEKLAHVSQSLKGKGFVPRELLHEIGVVTGSVPDVALASLSEVPGVSAVERDRKDYRAQG
jgi:hypothetical protein